MTAAWQQGFPLEVLKARAAVFAEHDDGLILGAFTRVKENQVADWMAHAALVGQGEALIARRRLTRPSKVRDFTGEVRATLPAETVVVDRFASTEAGRAELAGTLRAMAEAHVAIAVHGWMEHPFDREFLTGLLGEPVAIKIRASSELVGLWASPTIRRTALPRTDELGIAALALEANVADAAAEAESVGEWAQHYSSYNKRKSWTAVGLRTFGGDPLFIEKPAEMSRKWKAEHPVELASSPSWSPLAEDLPACRALAESLPAPLERVRLMRLAGGSGELTRHADITDRDAGTAHGKLLRIHFPLITNDRVLFRSWPLDGSSAEPVHMTVGQAWYLDTRKPHAAQNLGTTDRVHLVVDAWSTPQLLALLP